MKKYFIMGLILILLFCVSSISASDVNETNLISENNNEEIVTVNEYGHYHS